MGRGVRLDCFVTRAVEGGECRANRGKEPRGKGARRRVSRFGRPCASMCTAVLIIAGGRAYYRDRPPVTEFYTLMLENYTRCSMRSARSPGSMSMTGISIIV